MARKAVTRNATPSICTTPPAAGHTIQPGPWLVAMALAFRVPATCPLLDLSSLRGGVPRAPGTDCADDILALRAMTGIDFDRDPTRRWWRVRC